MKRITLIYVNGGGGHLSGARAIEEGIRLTGMPWDVELVNLEDLLKPLDPMSGLTGIHVTDAYNFFLTKGWTRAWTPVMRATQAWAYLMHRPVVNLLARHWSQRPPDVLVSLMPLFNRALCASFARAAPGRPFVTVMRDIADHPPRFWIERQRQYLMCGSDRAVQQAVTMGMPPNRIVRSSGMILNPRFHTLAPIDREAERTRLGLDPRRLTGLVMFGGVAPRKTMLQIDRLLSDSGLPVQLIFLCGRNQPLVDELRNQPSRIPRWVEGFTSAVPYWMQLADFFIGKPGPGSLSEAAFMGLPVIVERNASTMPQESYNPSWVRENGFGIVVRSFSQLPRAVSALLDPVRYERIRANTRAVPNRGLYEFLQLAHRLLREETPLPEFDRPEAVVVPIAAG